MTAIVKDFKVKIDQKEILRILGHTSPEWIHSERAKNIKGTSKKLIEEMIELSFELIKSKGIYTIVELRELPKECLFNSAENVAFCICTIGEDLEKKVEKLSHNGDLARAVILDAIGSVAAESTAEYLSQVILAQAQTKRLYSSARFSPGYGGWKLESQKFIFNLLPAQKIKVRLNQSFMMIPRKSVSFALNLSSSPFKDKKSTPCEICGLKDCRFKKVNNIVEGI